MGYINSFAPVADASATCLILGSMPGQASLDARQYYAHPRNAFWPIMGSILGFEVDLPYGQRCAALIRQRIALWDVLQACERTGSLDSAIVSSSIAPNDFATFFQYHPFIGALYFNGALAEKTYRTQVKPGLPAVYRGLSSIRLPSTSPAHAALNYAAKLAQWRIIVGG